MLVDSAVLYALGLVLVFVGMTLIIIAVVLLVFSSIHRGRVKGGGAILIGPIPIVFGTDRKSLKTVLLLSLALTVMLVVAMVVCYLLLR